MRYVIVSVFTTLLFVGNITLNGQSRGINREKYRLNIKHTDKNIIIDGVLDEEPWLLADSAGHFQRVQPTDTGFAKARTEVRLTYDNSNLYLGIVCYDPTLGKRPVESLHRDFNFNKNDNFITYIDTYNDMTNSFCFGVSAAGAERDGLGANGGTVSNDWDTKWRSSVKNYKDRWVAEICIPFRSIRYREGVKEWGINFTRLDLKTAEKSSWAPMPRQFATATLAYTGTLVWDKPLEKAGPRFSLIPYVSAKATRDNEAGEDTKFDANAGLDAKVIVSTSMNLDLTINPDYSQVEADRQLTNLSRFELFFPEKRQFFLENSDLFANLGTTSDQPFFSRRIGLNNPVETGARLSGKIGNDTRIGVMDIQTDSKEDIPASNFAVAVLQRKVFARSYITGFLVNKQITGNFADSTYSDHHYNRVAGIEYNLASADNRWMGKAFYHQSFYPGASTDASTLAGNLAYSTQFLLATLNQVWIGADYLAEVGYIRRKGYYEINPGLQYKFFPHSGKLVYHGPFMKFDMIFKPGLLLTDRETQFGYQISWQNRSLLSIDVKEDFVRLLSSFDPTNTGGKSLAEGEAFNWHDIGITYSSDDRELFNYKLGSRYGSYYNGTRWNLNGELYYRLQPYGYLVIIGSYDKILLPVPYNSAKLILIGPRLDITFTKNLIFTALVQYNDQIENINTNLRLQWRFAPVSDIYIIYTDNSYSDNFHNKNRGLFLKISYWFN
jgi:hypothetical protein